MEPDVIRLYSSSPPPLDEGAEEEDDEFGDFGGFGGAMASSFSFTELDTPPTQANQSQARDTAPPDLPVGPTAPGAGKISAVDGTTSLGSLKQSPAVVDGLHQDPTESGLGAPRTEASSLHMNGDTTAPPQTLANGFPETDAQNASVDTTLSALSSSSPCVPPGSEDTDHHHIDISQHTATSEAGTSLANGFTTKLHTDTEQEHTRDASAAATVAPEGQEASFLEEGVTTRDEGMSETPQGPVDSGFHPEACETERSAQSLVEERTPSPSHDGQEGEGLPEDQDMESDVHPAADEDLPTSSGPTQTSASDDFASFCEVVSPGDLDEFGDFGDFSSMAPNTTAEGPPHPSDAPEDDRFGSFGESGTHSTQGFQADFSQTESGTRTESFVGCPDGSDTHPSEADRGQTLPPHQAQEDNDEATQGGQFGDLPVSDSFADFQSVSVGGGGGGVEGGEDWAAFEEPPVDDQGGADGSGTGGGWAAFGEDQTKTNTNTNTTGSCEVEESQWQDGAADTASIFGSSNTSRRDSLTASLSSRLQRLFQASFPHTEAPQVGEEIPSLKALLEPQEPADAKQEQSNQLPTSAQREPQDMWRHLQDIHSALGLKFLWGGSHSNKQLLRCLTMDTRNIVFAGQKKKPVLVPAFAAGLGMLEPTKDPMKASSAAGPMAASAQAPPGAADRGASSKPTQEALSSTQPDWSSSGLKPPVDGVDPELYELTTVPLESNNASKHVADAFTRLMSTMEQNSTSTRKPARDENLSEEAARVLNGLPNLSFMRAKVLMFPSILTPQPPAGPSS